MKKTPFIFALVLVSAVLFSSCTSIRWSFKKNLSELPAKESAIVVFDNANSAMFNIQRWNGIDINSDLYGIGIMDKNDRTELTVPPGNNSFTFDVSFYVDRITRYEARNIELQYNLQAGNKYIVKTRINTTKTDTGRTVRTGITTSNVVIIRHEFFVGIYPDARNSEPLREWSLGDNLGR